MTQSFHIDIAGNRSTTNYTPKEKLARVAWGAGQCVFRNIPIPLFSLRSAWLRCFGAKVGRDVHIYPSARIWFPWMLEVADESSIGPEAWIYNLGTIQIGQQVTISHRAHLCAGTHDYRDPRFPLQRVPIRIHDCVWVCADAFIGPGVTVHQGAVVGARAVVFRDVAEAHVVLGNPAVTVKLREFMSPSPSVQPN